MTLVEPFSALKSSHYDISQFYEMKKHETKKIGKLEILNNFSAPLKVLTQTSKLIASETSDLNAKVSLKEVKEEVPEKLYSSPSSSFPKWMFVEFITQTFEHIQFEIYIKYLIINVGFRENNAKIWKI